MLPLVELEARYIAQIVQSVPGGAANIQDIYPLAPLQEEILLRHLLNIGSGDPDVVAIVLSVSSWDRLEQLVTAFQPVIHRHDVLRTAVLWEQLPRPVQVIYRDATLSVGEIPLNRDRNPLEQIRKWILPSRQGLDLQHAPLMRLRVAPHPYNGQWYGWLQLHRIVVDAVTVQLMASEITAYLSGFAQRLSKPVPYRNYVAQSLAYAETPSAEEFFRRKLGKITGQVEPLELRRSLANGTRVEVAEAHSSIELELSQRIRIRATQLGVSASVLFHSACGLLLAHINGGEDVVFGSVLKNPLQHTANSESMFGSFINTLPLRLQLGGMTVQEFVEHTDRELVELLEHQPASPAIVRRCSGIDVANSLSGTLLEYQYRSPTDKMGWGNVKGVEVLGYFEQTNYPIVLIVEDSGDEFTLTSKTNELNDPHQTVAGLQMSIGALVLALETSPLIPALGLVAHIFSMTNASNNSTVKDCAEVQIVHPHRR